jgi:hypothetical protein
VYDARGSLFLPYISVWSRRTVVAADVFDEARWRAPCSVTAVVALGHQQQIESALSELGAGRYTLMSFPVGNAKFRELWGLVIRASGANKASALASIAEHHGIPIEETVTVGDWINDMSMLAAAGRSFAMAQAPPEVKACATDQLAASVETGGGIREAAERSGLL